MPHANPFGELTRTRGAVMRDYAGVELPETFGDPLKESIDDRSDSETSLGVHGPRAAEVLEASASGLRLPDAEIGHVQATLAGAPVSIIRSQWTGEAGFDLVVPRSHAASIWDALLAAGAPLGLRPVGMAAANI